MLAMTWSCGWGTYNSKKSSDFVVAAEFTKKRWTRGESRHAQEKRNEKAKSSIEVREKTHLSLADLEGHIGAGGN